MTQARDEVRRPSWMEKYLRDTRDLPLSECEVFVLPKGWFENIQFCGLSTDAIMLHFVSWSMESMFPKYKGHVSFVRDRHILYNRRESTVHRIRNELVAAGLRDWCDGNGYKKRCDDRCQPIVGWYSTHVGTSQSSETLRRAARAVLPTDSLSCEICGAIDDLTVDHIVPIARGGGNDRNNLRILCRPCNSKKGARF